MDTHTDSSRDSQTWSVGKRGVSNETRGLEFANSRCAQTRANRPTRRSDLCGPTSITDRAPKFTHRFFFFCTAANGPVSLIHLVLPRPVKVGPKMCKKCYGKKNPRTVTGKRIKLDVEEEAMPSVGDELDEIVKIYQCRCACNLAPPPPARARFAHPPASLYHPRLPRAALLSHPPARVPVCATSRRCRAASSRPPARSKRRTRRLSTTSTAGTGSILTSQVCAGLAANESVWSSWRG